MPGSKREKEKKVKREREGRKESLVVASSAPLRKAHKSTKRSKAATATHARTPRPYGVVVGVCMARGKRTMMDGWMMMDRVDRWMN